MPKYATNTTGSSELSRIEIEKTLIRYGANQFAYATSGDKAMIAFVMNNRQLRFLLPLPLRSDFTKTPTGKTRVTASQEEAYQQACRQRWRALHLAIKAKLEAVECGISEFDEEFLAQIVLPGTMETVGSKTIPQIKEAYQLGETPHLMLLGDGTSIR